MPKNQSKLLEEPFMLEYCRYRRQYTLCLRYVDTISRVEWAIPQVPQSEFASGLYEPHIESGMNGLIKMYRGDCQLALGMSYA